MTRHDDDEKPICKDCGDPITDAYTSPEYCTDCLDDHENDDSCEEDV